MLKVSYVSSGPLVEKPKESPKEAFIKNARDTLALREYHDKVKAKEMFSVELAELEVKELYYIELSKQIAHLV